MKKIRKKLYKKFSVKLLEWTNKRWIISLSKKEGNKTIRDTTEIFKKIFR